MAANRNRARLQHRQFERQSPAAVHHGGVQKRALSPCLACCSASIQSGVEVVSLEAIDQERCSPAHDEQRNNAVAERAEIIVEVRDRLPERTLKLELIRDQAE